MRIVAHQLGKRFDDRWVFRHLQLMLQQGNAYAIRGNNGVGKSSLLLALCNFILISEGTVQWEQDETPIPPQRYKDYFHLVSPHLEIPLEWSVREFLEFSLRLDGRGYDNTTIDQWIEDAYLEKYVSLRCYQLSSGTIRRLSLVTCFHSEKPVLMLDEFSSHLDDKGKDWAFSHVQRISPHKLVIISTNDATEGELCSQQIVLSEYRSTSVLGG